MDKLEKIMKRRSMTAFTKRFEKLYQARFAKALTTMSAKDVAAWLDYCGKGTVVRCIRVTTPSGGTIELMSPRSKVS